ncbi:hypothetical protein L596_020845 [Steinernema carpocapsae]|uniref:Uncharacterized protein n=1 Tax=Steinernema carpocapsae TaxID=34508 RepID=A0A4U5MUQ4_STECR|nr:hypothetical protein L596_020771 [Steinernema carpocapsae]TKR73546.1 hypothetical protein L596_020845 [Steinernema carpocapsae]
MRSPHLSLPHLQETNSNQFSNTCTGVNLDKRRLRRKRHLCGAQKNQAERSGAVVDLTAEMNNAKYNFSRSEKAMLTDFINNIRVLIAGNASLSIEAVIKAVAYHLSQLIVTGSFLKFPIGTSFDFGTFGDLIDASDFGSRIIPTTNPAPTTTPVQVDCSSAPSLLSIFNGNMTISYQYSDTYLKNNPDIQAPTSTCVRTRPS